MSPSTLTLNFSFDYRIQTNVLPSIELSFILQSYIPTTYEKVDTSASVSISCQISQFIACIKNTIHLDEFFVYRIVKYYPF